MRGGPARWWAVLGCLLLASCAPTAPAATPVPTPPPIGSCSLPLPATATAQDAITAVIQAEGNYVVSQDIDRLMRLWADDARITDANHTPDNTADDQAVQGTDAIRYRYVRFVFPSAPGQVLHPDLQISLDGDRAEAISTTHIGDNVTPGGDHWMLTRVSGCWVISSLTYNNF